MEGHNESAKIVAALNKLGITELPNRCIENPDGKKFSCDGVESVINVEIGHHRFKTIDFSRITNTGGSPKEFIQLNKGNEKEPARFNEADAYYYDT